ncbi:glycoside hydrolase family protein [Niallia sp. 03091]|uniref:glycoside hydrolase family protein n=1 Tax=Niallia sp. 03091 TaxID=3458059 RepID=UPI004044C40C
MKTSKNGIDLIKKFEGCRLIAYKPVPTEKHYTIGYGHYGPDVRLGQVITQAQAEKLLKDDLKKYEDGVLSAIKVSLNQNQFDALVSFAYNLGVGALKSSDLAKYINKKDLVGAGKEFAKWIHAGGNVLSGLVKRRAAEAELFFKPVPKPKPQQKPKPKPKPKSKPAPKPAAKKYYTVKKGEILSNIAKKEKTTIAVIKKLNPNIKDINKIYPNQEIRIK